MSLKSRPDVVAAVEMFTPPGLTGAPLVYTTVEFSRLLWTPVFMGVVAVIPARPALLMPAVGAGEAKLPPGVDSTPLPTAPVPTNPLLEVEPVFKLSGFACVLPVVPEGPAMAPGNVGVPAVFAEVGLIGPAAAWPDTPPTRYWKSSRYSNYPGSPACFR